MSMIRYRANPTSDSHEPPTRPARRNWLEAPCADRVLGADLYCERVTEIGKWGGKQPIDALRASQVLDLLLPFLPGAC
jgi:hypothetical protein